MAASPSVSDARSFPGWLKALFVAVIVLLLGIGVVYVMGLSATRRWNQLTRQLHDKGQPVTLLEIESRRPIPPDEQNMAHVIERIMETHDQFPGPPGVPSGVFVFGSTSPDFFKGLERTRIEESREYLEKYKAILPDLSSILSLENGRFSLDLTPPAVMVMLPHTGPIRTLGQLSRLAGTVALVDGRMNEAQSQVLVQFQIPASLDDEPILISRLVQMALERQASRSIEDCMRVGELKDDLLAELADAVDRRLARAKLQPAFLGERAIFIDTCASILNGRLAPPAAGMMAGTAPNWVMSMPRLPVWVVRENQIKGTEMLTWAVDAGEDFAALQTAAGKIDAETPGLSQKYSVVQMMMPSLSRAIVLHIKTIANLRAARATLAAERFRLAQGRLPASLDELVPDYLDTIPVDPFDGNPLRFRTTDEGIVIYSIDENLYDNDGDVTYPGGNTQPSDIGLRLVRPELRGLIIIDAPDEDEPNE